VRLFDILPAVSDGDSLSSDSTRYPLIKTGSYFIARYQQAGRTLGSTSV